MVDYIFLLSAITIASGVVGLCVRYSFRSKCTSVGCCFGLLSFTRDIQQEVALEEKQTEQIPRGLNSSLSLTESPRSPSMSNI